ncbi:hypothetical protein Trydic_g1852 [Trypoxylus dichotomus]
MSKFSKDIDNKNLFETLNQAVQADKLYWVQNEAKIRASYTSKNYDEFREIVAAAHLYPVQRKDAHKRKVGWNRVFQDGNNDE